MPGADLTLLAHRLRRCGFTVHLFRYASIRGDFDATVERLWRFAVALQQPELHWVGHSLGGLLIRHLFARHPDLPPGRVVTLGTPHTGSVVANRFHAHRLGRLLLGDTVSTEALTVSPPPWDGRRPLGSIAGGLGVGVGRLVPVLARPNDGTVSVAETCAEGMRDHIVLPVAHMGLLLSADTARQTCRFLLHGCFAHPVTSGGD